MPDQPETPKGKTVGNYDPALVLAKAGLSAIPVIGGSLASLIDAVPTAAKRNIENGIALLRDRLTDLQSRFDTESVDKEEFSELFQSCARLMERTHRDEKLRAAANILANLLLKPGDQAKVSYDELDHLIRCVDALSIGAITVLGAVRHISATHPRGPNVDTISFGDPRAKLPQMEPALIRSLVAELRSFHLVRVQEGGIRGYAEAEDDGSLLTLSPIGTSLIERFIEDRAPTKFVILAQFLRNARDKPTASCYI
jgi:hypothetical protein